MSHHDGEEPCDNCKATKQATDNLRDAIQEYANAIHAGDETAVFVAESVVVFETMRMNPDGSDSRAIFWTIPSDHWSLATAVGLLDMGKGYIKADLIKVRPKDRDEGGWADD